VVGRPVFEPLRDPGYFRKFFLDGGTVAWPNFCLVALYPAVDATERREIGTWWSPQVLVFTQNEMRRFLNAVKTVDGKRDAMFGFGFDGPGHAFQTRGDSARRYEGFSPFLLPKRLRMLRKFLSAR
jgi:hypothetical protein